MQVNIINQSPFELPSYATVCSAGMDLRANISDTIVLKSLERALVPIQHMHFSFNTILVYRVDFIKIHKNI
jgi:dUTPase